jgi:hypothetical protein
MSSDLIVTTFQTLRRFVPLLSSAIDLSPQLSSAFFKRLSPFLYLL